MKITPALKKDLKDIASLMIEEFSKPPFNEKTHFNNVIKSLEFYYNIGKIFVAVHNEKIIGAIVFKIERWWEGEVILIEDLAVKKEYIKRKIGRSLIGYLEDFAKKNNIKKVIFYTDKKTPELKDYKKLGYKLNKRVVSMEKKLE